MQQFDWYFDLISPFAYLQSERLHLLPGVPRLRPILFGVLLAENGQLGPAEIETKRLLTYRMVQWRAREQGIRLTFPPAHPFNPVALNRLAILLGDDLGKLRTLFRAVWAEGWLPESSADLDALGARLGIRDASQRINRQEIKQTLRDHTQAALDAGVFGVPTAVVDGQLFWGADSQGLLGAYLRGEVDFGDDEMGRYPKLPVAVKRQR